MVDSHTWYLFTSVDTGFICQSGINQASIHRSSHVALARHPYRFRAREGPRLSLSFHQYWDHIPNRLSPLVPVTPVIRRFLYTRYVRGFMTEGVATLV